MDQAGVQGVQVAVLGNGKTAWHASFGLANAETKAPVTDASVFEAASLSKPVFAYAVLKLVDAGKIDLDTPISSYLPGRYDVGDDARLAQITPRHVLSHRVGLPELEVWQRSAEDLLHPGRAIQLLRRGLRVPGRCGRAGDGPDARGLHAALGVRSAGHDEQQLRLAAPVRGSEGLQPWPARLRGRPAHALAGERRGEPAHHGPGLCPVRPGCDRRQGTARADSAGVDVAAEQARREGHQYRDRRAHRSSCAVAGLGAGLGTRAGGRGVVAVALGRQRDDEGVRGGVAAAASRRRAVRQLGERSCARAGDSRGRDGRHVSSLRMAQAARARAGLRPVRLGASCVRRGDRPSTSTARSERRARPNPASTKTR